MANFNLYKLHVDCRVVYTTPSASGSAVTMAGVAFSFPDGVTRIALDGTALHAPVFDYTHFSVPYGSITCYFLITRATWINSACWEIEYRLDGALTGWSNWTALNIGGGILVRTTDTTKGNKWLLDPEYPMGAPVTVSSPVITSGFPVIVVVVASLAAGIGTTCGLTAYTISTSEYAQLCIDTAGTDAEAPYRQSVIKGVYLMYGVSGGTASPIPYRKPDGTSATFTAQGAQISSLAPVTVSMTASGTDFTNCSPFVERMIYIPGCGYFALDTANMAVTSSVGVTLCPDPVNGITSAFLAVDGSTRWDIPLGKRHAPTLPVLSSTLAMMKVEHDIQTETIEQHMALSMLSAANPLGSGMGMGSEAGGALAFAGMGSSMLTSAVSSLAQLQLSASAYEKRTACMSANMNGGGGGDCTNLTAFGRVMTHGSISSTTDFWNNRGCMSGKVCSKSDLSNGNRHWVDLSTSQMKCSKVIAKRIIDDFADGIYVGDT